MDTLVLERGDKLLLLGDAEVVRTPEQFADVAPDYAAAMGEWALDSSSSNPYIKWISGRYVQSGEPNSNTQFWTAGDLSMAEYSIKFAPLNVNHKVRTPIGFFLETRKVFASDGEQAGTGKDFTIEALSGMWSHVFPFEAALVDKADEDQSLFYSMECIGTHLRCEGPNGCGEEFEYAAYESHCVHLRERASVRHIVNPTFRGGALIIPPVKPGWKDANATVYESALLAEAARYAEESEQAFEQAKQRGADLTASQWEAMMAAIISNA